MAKNFFKNSPKNRRNKNKGTPSSYAIVLSIVLLLLLIVQGTQMPKSAKVSFSHQVEHIVNLGLLDHDKNAKTALNDNLVTFSGTFKESLSKESKQKFRYLQLLNENHQLSSEKSHLLGEIAVFKDETRSAVNYFYTISGYSLPDAGLQVVSSSYSTSDFDSTVVIKRLLEKNQPNLKKLELEFASLSETSSKESVQKVGNDLLYLFKLYRSSQLGIGIQKIKNQMTTLEKSLQSSLESSTLSVKEVTDLINERIGFLQEVSTSLLTKKDNILFTELRSTRSYIEALTQFTAIYASLEKNMAELTTARANVSNAVWFFNDKELTTKALERQDDEVYSQWFSQTKKEWEAFDQNKGLSFKAPDQSRTTVLDKTFPSVQPPFNFFGHFAVSILPLLIVMAVIYFLFSKQGKGGASGAMSFGKSPAKLIEKDKLKITFKDVAGVDEAKEELEEIVDFLKDPKKFTDLGAKIPRGVLCVGSPGTGKTLVAKAVAGEANRAFFSISGSDFVEMFVGVGASRIRDLFEQAKKHAPCIIFIDEIDAVGRHRGSGTGGGNDEREQTLNQLLVEMDGMSSSEGIIIMAATNRPDVLDKALLRPGRFDRRVVLDLPDLNGRFDILKVHAKKIKLDKDVDLKHIARKTPGASGADLANILNEAALLAARKGRKKVTHSDLKIASDKVRFGKERKSFKLKEKEREATAYHEAGHAIVAMVVENAEIVEKVTIIPRGQSLGATHFLPKDNRVGYMYKESLDQLAVLMGGRVAEEMFVDDISSGASGDIRMATSLARSMVCEWGMSKTLGLVAYDTKSDAGMYLGSQSVERSYSEETSQKIDDEVKVFIDEAFKRAQTILNDKKDVVEAMTRALMEFETIDTDDVEKIMSGDFDFGDKKLSLDHESNAHITKKKSKKESSEEIDTKNLTPQDAS